MGNKFVGIVGAGIMGTGIAQCFLEKGWKVVVYDINESAVINSINRIENYFQKKIDKQRITAEEQASFLRNLFPGKTYSDFSGCDLVIEASVENSDVKKVIFNQVEESVSVDCILATNTSSLSVTEIAEKTENSERVIGMHFFNPAPVMKLVEVIRGADTSDLTVSGAVDIVESLGKNAIVLNESPGFVVNRLLVPMINEAANLLSEGVAEARDIDSAMLMGCNHPVGPLLLADMIGLDVIQNVMQTLHEEFGDDKYRVNTLIRKLVRAGKLGKKSGAGFYKYQEN